jgi:UDP-N-acetylmuramoyl-tripeptide--D-alanyl-D-alanine ligase
VELSAGQIAAVTGGAVVAGDPAARACSWANDSRALEPGACFVAIVDARDGHAFVPDAFARGATVALVTRDVGVDVTVPAGAALVRVTDALPALAALGRAARDVLARATVVGITGSSGKTGTKDLLAAALARTVTVHASHLSFNNEIGLPLTLLGAPSSVEAVVLEMGARFPGNIRDLCAIARPGVAVVTNIGTAHGGLLGGPDGVARVKGELLEALPADGLAVLPADDPATPVLAPRTTARVLRAGTDVRTADVRVADLELDAELRVRFTLGSPWGSGPVRLALHGAHHATNAALAATVALASGVPFDDVVAGLEGVGPLTGRMRVVRAASGALLVDDAYNANPGSMAAALDALAGWHGRGRRIAVLGDMLELGDDAPAAHADLGARAAAGHVDVLVAVGPAAATLAAAARHAPEPIGAVTEVADAPEAVAAVRALAPGADDAVLVKASHSLGLELVVAELESEAGAVG